MGLLCWLFGHRSTEGVNTGSEYMRLRPFAVDGIGREHAHIHAHCPRCGDWYVAGRTHRPQEWFDGKDAPVGYKVAAGGGWVRESELR